MALNARANQEFSDRLQHLEQLEQERDTLNAENENLRDLVNKLTKENETLKQRLQHLEEENRRLKNALEEMKQELMTVKTELQETKLANLMCDSFNLLLNYLIFPELKKFSFTKPNFQGKLSEFLEVWSDEQADIDEKKKSETDCPLHKEIKKIGSKLKLDIVWILKKKTERNNNTHERCRSSVEQTTLLTNALSTFGRIRDGAFNSIAPSFVENLQKLEGKQFSRMK
eukprot:TRINITY_DN8106_c0_g1_i6.p1 TRINITY_DN8106_c0_g1~~TRINITY_DN8106_c0_g1_i6.p1  ORF type:complete len:264 (-),score=55.27 TRINITY_DN8106_c0_g1_i6:20-703(-)